MLLRALPRACRVQLRVHRAQHAGPARAHVQALEAHANRRRRAHANATHEPESADGFISDRQLRVVVRYERLHALHGLA